MQRPSPRLATLDCACAVACFCVLPRCAPAPSAALALDSERSLRARTFFAASGCVAPVQVDEISAAIWGYRLENYSACPRGFAGFAMTSCSCRAGVDVVMVFVIGTLWRVVAYLLMINTHKDKQT